jgi:capsid protein
MLASDKSAWTWKQLDLYSKKSGAPLVLHLFDKVRPGQSRGVPYLAPVIELIKQLGRYTDAEVMAAVVSGKGLHVYNR